MRIKARTIAAVLGAAVAGSVITGTLASPASASPDATPFDEKLCAVGGVIGQTKPCETDPVLAHGGEHWVMINAWGDSEKPYVEVFDTKSGTRAWAGNVAKAQWIKIDGLYSTYKAVTSERNGGVKIKNFTNLPPECGKNWVQSSTWQDDKTSTWTASIPRRGISVQFRWTTGKIWKDTVCGTERYDRGTTLSAEKSCQGNTLPGVPALPGVPNFNCTGAGDNFKPGNMPANNGPRFNGLYYGWNDMDRQFICFAKEMTPMACPQ